MSKLKVVHYLNQFFAGIGGEEKADVKPEVRKGVIGPGLALNKEFGADAEIIATIICGDSYFNENLKEAQPAILSMIKELKPDLFVAGPAFNAGRYGTACGTICKAVKEELQIPAITAMYEENPGVDMFRKDLYIVKTANNAAGMRTAAPALAKLALKMVRNETIGTPEEEGYHVRGVRKNIFREKIGGERAVEMMIRKLKGEPFVTEYPMPVFDNVAPSPAIKDMKHAKIALVTSGGIVSKGNPDHIESSSASKYGSYDISRFQTLTSADHETAHGGYDPVYANNDPNRVLPLDAVRQMEKEGRIGSLHQYFYSTVGNGTSVANSKKFASTFANNLIADGVQAVILTST